jgi:hypothetical protein
MARISELLNGKQLTRENLYELQRSPKASGMSQEYDADYSATVESALRALNSQDDPMNKKIPFAQSEVLQRLENSHLSVELLRQKMKSPKYSGERWERDPEYIKAIEDGFAELFPEPETTDEGVRPGMVLHHESAPANENAVDNDYNDIIDRYRQSLEKNY